MPDQTIQIRAVCDAEDCGSTDLGCQVGCVYFTRNSSMETDGIPRTADLPEYAVVRLLCHECGWYDTANTEEAAVALKQVPLDN